MGAGNKTGSQPQGRHGLTREDLVGESAPLPAFHRGISRISRRPSQTEAAAKASQLEVVQLVLNLAFRFHLQSGSIWFYKATDAWEDERPVGTHGLWSLSCQVAALRSHEKFGLGDGAQHQVLLTATNHLAMGARACAAPVPISPCQLPAQSLSSPLWLQKGSPVSASKQSRGSLDPGGLASPLPSPALPLGES